MAEVEVAIVVAELVTVALPDEVLLVEGAGCWAAEVLGTTLGVTELVIVELAAVVEDTATADVVEGTATADVVDSLIGLLFDAGDVCELGELVTSGIADAVMLPLKLVNTTWMLDDDRVKMSVVDMAPFISVVVAVAFAVGVASASSPVAVPSRSSRSERPCKGEAAAAAHRAANTRNKNSIAGTKSSYLPVCGIWYD